MNFAFLSRLTAAIASRFWSWVSAVQTGLAVRLGLEVFADGLAIQGSRDAVNLVAGGVGEGNYLKAFCGFHFLEFADS